MVHPESQRTPPSDGEAWWWELWTTLTIEFAGYLLIQFIAIPYAIATLFIEGRVLPAAAFTVLWVPTIVFVVRDVWKTSFSRASWAFLGVWVVVLVGWFAYGYLVV